MALLPREAAKFISDESDNVKLDEHAIKELAQKLLQHWKNDEMNMQSFKQQELNPQTMDEAAIEWIFVADLLNFSFWSENPNQKYMVGYKGKEYTGYWSLCAAINRALDEGIPITSASYFATIPQGELAKIFRSDSDCEIPMLEERLANLHQAGQCLNEKYHGSFSNCLKQCNQSAQQLLDTVVRDFPSFNDTATYKGKTVCFYKRAQILVADIWACFEGEGLGTFKDIDEVTMFADYRIPQILHYYGAIKYTDHLLRKLEQGHLFNNGDAEEVEIRGCSIQAVAVLANELKTLMQAIPSLSGQVVNDILVDNFLWLYRRKIDKETSSSPFHRVRSIYY